MHFIAQLSDHHFQKLLEAAANGRVTTAPLTGAARILFIKEAMQSEQCIVVLYPDVKSLNESLIEFSLMDMGDVCYPITDFSPKLLQERLSSITQADKKIILAPYQLLKHPLPPKESIEKSLITVSTGESIGYEELMEYCGMLDFSREQFVEAEGQFSVRGAIIDVWSYSEKMPFRVEYDGDFIESIRYFDPENQRSTEECETVTLAGKLTGDGGDAHGTIFDYLTAPLFVIDESDLLAARGNGEEQAAQVQKPINPSEIEDDDLLIERALTEEILDISAQQHLTPPLFNSAEREELFNRPGTKWIIETMHSPVYNPGFQHPPVVKGNFSLLFAAVSEYAAKGYTMYVAVENAIQRSRMEDLITEYHEDFAALITSGRLKVVAFPVKEGFVHEGLKVLLFSDYQIFGKPYRTSLPPKTRKKSSTKKLQSITPGDYVVHEEFGIAMFAGLETIQIGEVEQETMKLIFAKGGVVYVNLNYLHLVKKFSSKEGAIPTLSTLGSGEWAAVKRKTKKKVKELARDLIELYAKRKAAEGFQFSADTIWQKELEATFLYEDTPDQAKAIEDVKRDMQETAPMDRLVCGDVGFGKTEVAVRAAFKCVQDGKQTAVLVPTTILAEQHYNTFKDRMSQFAVKVEVLSRFQTKQKQKEIIAQLTEGKVDVVIGTHRLLSKDVQFKDLGLLVIDEEHRFGVMAKEKLRAIKLNVDTLTLTATPIPRTLNFSMLGARDLSIIASPPPNRQPIRTSVEVFDIYKIRLWIRNEMNRGGQVYVVHDRIKSIYKLADLIKKYIPEVRLAIGHGQMKPDDLEKVIHDFLNRKHDVLLSTKIIESGIDIPNVNTIIVNRADRFGLAELHQLRGRVGRSDRQAYSYFLVPTLEGLQKQTQRRLKVIEEYSDLGAGFHLSMRDLEIRGAGNLLGKEQSGFVQEVGFDLYLKLIAEAVEELKLEDFREVFKNLPSAEMRTDPSIEAFFEISIPGKYIQEQTDRLHFYTQLLSSASLEEIEDMRQEMTDRFGTPPPQVERLLSAAVLKLHSSKALFERVVIQRKQMLILLPKGTNEEYYAIKFLPLMKLITGDYRDLIKFDQQKDIMKLIVNNRFAFPEEMLGFLTEFAIRVGECYRKG